MEEGLVNAWLIEEGDSFTKGQLICEIETSKITNELEAPFDGVLRKIVGTPGQTLPVGAVIGVSADASATDAEIEQFLAARGATAPAEERHRHQLPNRRHPRQLRLRRLRRWLLWQSLHQPVPPSYRAFCGARHRTMCLRVLAHSDVPNRSESISPP
ncbi:hypothetical protein GCM10020255_102290 [Rhodococcus baikonurensis]